MYGTVLAVTGGGGGGSGQWGCCHLQGASLGAPTQHVRLFRETCSVFVPSVGASGKSLSLGVHTFREGLRRALRGDLEALMHLACREHSLLVATIIDDSSSHREEAPVSVGTFRPSLSTTIHFSSPCKTRTKALWNPSAHLKSGIHSSLRCSLQGSAWSPSWREGRGLHQPCPFMHALGAQ